MVSEIYLYKLIHLQGR